MFTKLAHLFIRQLKIFQHILGRNYTFYSPVNNAKKLKIIDCIGYDITIAADAEPQNSSS